MIQKAVLALLVVFAAGVAGAQTTGQRYRGVNLVQTANAPLDQDAAKRSLTRLRSLGANTVAVIPFLFQQGPRVPDVSLGNAVPDGELVGGIRAAHALGFTVLLKPHIWIPGHWAGQVEMQSDGDWARWFAAYTSAILHYARIAEVEKVAVLSIGVELKQTTHRPEWRALIRGVRRVYRGKLTYTAHGDEIKGVPFWPLLDFPAVSLYPTLGTDTSTVSIAREIAKSTTALREFSRRQRRPLLVSEVGLRSADSGQVKPWESAEERVAAPDELIQARALALWLEALDRDWISGVLVWRWFSDPNAGGRGDTDFTVQNKLAEGVLLARWSRAPAEAVRRSRRQNDR